MGEKFLPPPAAKSEFPTMCICHFTEESTLRSTLKSKEPQDICIPIILFGFHNRGGRKQKRDMSHSVHERETGPAHQETCPRPEAKRGPSQGLTPDPSHNFDPNIDLIEQPASVRAHQCHPGRVFSSVPTHSMWERLCRQPLREPIVQPGYLTDGQREAQNHKARASVSLGLRWDPHAHLAGCLGDQKGPCIDRVCSRESVRHGSGDSPARKRARRLAQTCAHEPALQWSSSPVLGMNAHCSQEEPRGSEPLGQAGPRPLCRNRAGWEARMFILAANMSENRVHGRTHPRAGTGPLGVPPQLGTEARPSPKLRRGGRRAWSLPLPMPGRGSPHESPPHAVPRQQVPSTAVTPVPVLVPQKARRRPMGRGSQWRCQMAASKKT